MYVCVYMWLYIYEGVTAGLVRTGIVHADPHEGNVMLDNDGRLVMLDFGLMSTVHIYIHMSIYVYRRVRA